jgi:molybdate transport system substrate-binding protein
MSRNRWITIVWGAAIALILTFGLKLLAPVPTTAQASGSLLISAATSLQDALEAIDPLFEQANRSTTANYNFGSSGALQQQIRQGAPADVFISAAARQMDALQQAGLLLPGTRRNLLTNRLVLIVPRNSRLNLTGFRQLTSNSVRRIAVGEFRSVPVGQYAEELLRNLGILSQVQSKLVYANNVRGVLAAVESGNADAGIVYTTDARISNRVRQVATAPETLHSPIIYPIAVLNRSRNPQAARAYIQFLSTRQARAVFQRFGFGVAG